MFVILTECQSPAHNIRLHITMRQSLNYSPLRSRELSIINLVRSRSRMIYEILNLEYPDGCFNLFRAPTTCNVN
jgi:hypothetical protein